MSPAELIELSRIALRVATLAGDLARSGYRQAKVLRFKSENDLVTEFDTRSEALILEHLSRETPQIGIIGEEGGGSLSEYTWYVDPIDGTTNFAHGHPFWCVSIGLVRGGIGIAGAVVAPVLATSWSGVAGQQAQRNGEECEVSASSSLRKSLLATGFPYDRHTSEENNFDAFVALKKQVRGIRRCGSAALDLCLVADGTYDGYWERKLKPWDVAAGCAIVAGARGQLSNFHGGEVDVTDGYVVATNGIIHQQLLEALASAENRAWPAPRAPS